MATMIKCKKRELIYIFILSGFSSCMTDAACMTDAGCRRGIQFLGKHEANMVLYEKPTKSYETYKFIGKDLSTGRDTTICLKGRWYETLGKIWDAQDTVVKNKGELIITIYKKDNTVHWSEWTCDEIYLDGKSVGTGVPKRAADIGVGKLE